MSCVPAPSGLLHKPWGRSSGPADIKDPGGDYVTLLALRHAIFSSISTAVPQSHGTSKALFKSLPKFTAQRPGTNWEK